MSWRDLLLRLRALIARQSMEEELEEEMKSHIELQTGKYVAQGMSLEEASRRARIEFGGVEATKERCRDARRVNFIEALFQDFRYAVRGLRRDHMLALSALLTLAICIGANTTVFSLVDSIMLRPLPFPDSNRLYWINERIGYFGGDFGLGADYYSLREENRIFDDVGAYDTLTLNWTGVEKPEQLEAAQVTASFFNVFGIQPLLGRYLAPGEEGTKAPPVVVLSYAFWRSKLGSDPRALGKTIMLDGLRNTVIGIMPQGFDYPRGVQIWRPLPMNEADQRPRLVTRPMRMVSIIGRLKPRVSNAQITAELRRLTSTIRREYPKEVKSGGFLNDMQILAQPLQRRMTGDLRPALLVLSGAVMLVLLIACANLANLLLARAASRQRELAVRMALGSGRRRIVRQVLTESIVLAVPGGAAGAAIAYLAVAGLNAWKPLILQNYPRIALDAPTLLFTLGLTVITALVFGTAPALAAAGVDIQEALKCAGCQHSGARRSTRLRRCLVIGELAVCLILLIGAGLLGRSFLNLAGTDLGFPPENILTMRVNLIKSRYATAESQVRFYQDVLARVRQLPMVRHAAVSTDVPISGGHPFSGMKFQVAGRTPLPLAQQPDTGESVVSREYFRTLEIPLRSGRIFDSQDTGRSPNNIVVNEAFASGIFPGETPLGRQIVSGPNGSTRWTIVGVVGNIRAADLGAKPAPLIYRCTCQGGNPFLTHMSFIIRTEGNPRPAIRTIEDQIYSVDHEQPVFEVKTLEERLADSLAPQRFQLLLIGIFSGIAIVLAAFGVYGVMAYLVAQRTREIGIRIAMGARLQNVLWLIIGESLALSCIAIVAGIGGAWALTRYTASMLYGIAALDGPTFAIAPVVLGIIAVGASLVPALRASQIDPAAALREE
jgi:putative ABC transport system permease protein